MKTIMRGVPTLQDLTIGALEQATLLHPACDMRQKGSRGVIIFDRDWQRVWDMARDFSNQSSPLPQSKLRERWAPAPDEWADSHRPGKERLDTLPITQQRPGGGVLPQWERTVAEHHLFLCLTDGSLTKCQYYPLNCILKKWMFDHCNHLIHVVCPLYQ